MGCGGLRWKRIRCAEIRRGFLSKEVMLAEVGIGHSNRSLVTIRCNLVSDMRGGSRQAGSPRRHHHGRHDRAEASPLPLAGTARRPPRSIAQLCASS